MDILGNKEVIYEILRKVPLHDRTSTAYNLYLAMYDEPELIDPVIDILYEIEETKDPIYDLKLQHINWIFMNRTTNSFIYPYVSYQHTMGWKNQVPHAWSHWLTVHLQEKPRDGFVELELSKRHGSQSLHLLKNWAPAYRDGWVDTYGLFLDFDFRHVTFTPFTTFKLSVSLNYRKTTRDFSATFSYRYVDTYFYDVLFSGQETLTFTYDLGKNKILWDKNYRPFIQMPPDELEVTSHESGGWDHEIMKFTKNRYLKIYSTGHVSLHSPYVPAYRGPKIIFCLDQLEKLLLSE